MNGTPDSILVIAPHADDAEFGVGGYLVRRAEEGRAINVAILAEGGYTRADGRKVTYAARRKEAVAAIGVLSQTIRTTFLQAFVENQALEAPYTEVVGKIEKLIDQVQPTELFVCLPSFNQDHRVTYDAVVTATRPGRPPIARVLAYEYPGNCWGPQPEGGKTYLPFAGRCLTRKLTALRQHQSQFDGRPAAHVAPRGAALLAAQRGSECGRGYAELAYLMREIQ